MFRIHKNPTIRFLSYILPSIECRDMDEYIIREGVNIEKHVAATNHAESAMARWLSIKILNFIIALKNLERPSFYYSNDGHGSATNIRAVCTKAVMNFKRRFAVFKTNWVVSAPTPTCC